MCLRARTNRLATAVALDFDIETAREQTCEPFGQRVCGVRASVPYQRSNRSVCAARKAYQSSGMGFQPLNLDRGLAQVLFQIHTGDQLQEIAEAFLCLRQQCDGRGLDPVR